MTRTRKRWLEIGLIAVAVVGGIVAVLAGIPGLIDVESYKPGLIQAVRDTTGRELVIDGPMKLRMFPVPGVGAGTVRFANAVGAKGAQMIDVRWVAVRPSWSALLHGKVEVGTLTLYQPTIVLETDAKGVPNWEFAPGKNERQAEGAPSSGFHLAVGRLQIVGGTITYTNPQTKAVFTAENVNAGATVRSFDGPFEIDGEATVNGVPLKLDAAVGENTPAGHKARLKLEVSSGTLDFKGSVSKIGLDGALAGHLELKTGVLSDFVSSVYNALGAPKPAFDTSGAGRFSFDGDIDAAADHLTAKDFHLAMGKDDASGTLSIAAKPTPAISGKLALSRLDIGKWREILSRPMDFAPEPVKAVAPPVGPSPWSTVDVDLTVDVAEALWRNQSIRNLSATFSMDKGVAIVPRLKATGPGGLVLDADAGKGTFLLTASHLRDTLDWLGVEDGGIPRGALENFRLEGKLAAKENALQLSDGAFQLDHTRGTASGTLSLKTPLTVSLALGTDRFELDPYMPRPASTPEAAAAAPVAAPPAPAPQPSPNAAVIGLKLDIAKLGYRGETLNGVTGGATWRANVLRLDDIKVADLLGAKLGLKGQVSDFGTTPRFDLAFTETAPDTDKLLDYAGLPKFVNGKIGASTASGNVAGTRGAVTVRDVAAHLVDTDVRLSGTLAFTSPATFDFRSFALQTPEAAKFVSVASGKPMSGIGPISATGTLKGSEERTIFTGDLSVRDSAMNGTLDATLGKRPKLAANLNVPKTLDIDSLLGIEDDSAPAPLSPDEAPSEVRHARPARKATPKPIDLAALRSFDADLVISAKAMSMAALTVDYADLNATLKGGVFKINKLTGQFYKGAVDFAGTIDASGQALAIDASGTLLGIHLDELLRGTVGTNAFGQAYRITVDGKLDARGIRLTGKGVSAAELRESLSTATTVSGTVRAGMDGGTQSFAQFATGVGSLFSDTMGFDRAVLSGFVNQENAVSGGVVLGAGALTLHDQTVRGNGATAVISGRNRFADGTTDTTVSVTNGSRQYIARITGKLSSPVIAADSK
jgi:uncharacterized protein involved in outer membrane biogenesis